MARNNGNQRGRNNNNSEGRNQYSGSTVVDYARERPVTAAAAAAAAVGAGVFLWSRRSQISDQLTGLSDQIGQWSEQMMNRQNSESSQFETAGGTNLSSASVGSETGSGNSSLGSTTGSTGTSNL